MSAIALLTFYAMCAICKYSMIPLPAVLTLWNTRVYIHFHNHCDVIAYAKAFINEMFCICAVFQVPNVNLYRAPVA